MTREHEHDNDVPADKIPFRARLQWPNVFTNLFIHLGFFVGFYQMVTLQPKFQTYIWCKFFSSIFLIFTAKHFVVASVIQVLIFCFP